MVTSNPIPSNSIQAPQSAAPVSGSPAEAHSQFSDHLKNAIENVNSTNKASDEMTKGLANGEVDDLHEVMIASEKASITTQTSVEIRNKVVDAYKEIMRMQV
ncbi:flagellar hook-basal body complex protein FliE [Halobacillus sp. A5]|uniref:flagellar hook-basal body complex protein FliE n=1 Tax=Halobacillus sp. A5 TaxID=2880263 RepID=UPI0020A6503C|nr:flagellar hook-basal body complex protein FliE [Halobacillus sp. A5]MCP3026126.1 flagellar hook-basal body complex protein FliE [Halobacillus sp. A5]